ncbi:MAG: alpha/beta fold hydrolase [Bdellovibrionales bacterium]
MTERLIKFQNYTLGALEWGDDSNPTLVCFHGWLDNAASFIPVAQFLEKDFHILAFDLPGHGNSDHLDRMGQYHLFDSVLVLEEIRLHLKADKLNLFCHSLGGVIASLYCASFPDRVERFFSVEAMGPISNTEDMGPENLRHYIDRKLILNQKQKKQHKTIESGVKARARDGQVSEETARILVERGLKKNSSENYEWKSDIRMSLPSPLRLTEDQVRVFLSKIECPYYLCFGKDGLEMVRKVIDYRSDCIAKLSTQELPGGHHLHMEYPELVASWLSKNY